MQLLCCCRWASIAVPSLEKPYSVLCHSRHAWLVFPQDIVPLDCIFVVHFIILISKSEHECAVLWFHRLQNLHQHRQDVEVRHIGPDLASKENENEINAFAVLDDITFVVASAPVT